MRPLLIAALASGGFVLATISLAWAGKPVVGIAAIQTAAQNISCKGWDAHGGRDCNQNLTEGFRVMLETAIVKSNKMDVMERRQLTGVLEEQGLGQLGLTTSGGQVGGLTGVDYLIYGSITRFGARKSGFSISGASGLSSLLGRAAGAAFGGGLGAGSVTTEMAVDLKITDVATGKIILADTVKGEAKQGESFSVAGISKSETGADPFADVQRIVAAKISEAVVTTKIPFKVIKVQADGTLILNYGNVFLKAGDMLAAFEVGEQFIDPDTDEVLGSEETEIGMVQVVAAQSRFSKARVVGEGVPIVAGSILKRSKIAVAKEGPAKRKMSGSSFNEPTN